MQLPFFYIDDYDGSQKTIVLNEDSSRHVVQVLRMKEGDRIKLTDGKGNVLVTSITDAHKKNCSVSVEQKDFIPRKGATATIAISLLKNTSRFEWFLEKAVEIGVSGIIPLICARTEKQKFRHDRMQGICISAMLQSQQNWLPVLHAPLVYDLLFEQEDTRNTTQKFVAHCEDNDKKMLTEALDDSTSPQLILIGPEGDFTVTEIQLALANEFTPVALGDTRLRTETAGVVAASLLMIR
jgi:16S rRNA (uracil1498-N3)-methyltransferase